MPRGRYFRGRNDSNRRKTEWSQFLQSPAFVSIASTASVLLSSLSFENPGTIVRTRGMISIRPGTTGADLDFVGAYGCGIVSAEALAIGATAIPSPFSDADWGGWMVLQPFAGRWEQATDIGRQIASWEYEIDSKAMRKVEPNSAMVFMVESGVGAFNFADPVRALQMLH